MAPKKQRKEPMAKPEKAPKPRKVKEPKEVVKVEEPVVEAVAQAPEPEPKAEVYVPLKGYTEPPEPFVERQHPDDLPWIRDYYDDAIPSKPGFVTDLIFHSRGYETPTLAVIWTALFIISAAVKREAWFKWTPKYLFTNQYIIIIGPAGVVKKTTAITDIGMPILKKFRSYIQDPQFAEMKHIHVVKDKITPEAMLQGMLPENKEGTSFFLKDPNGEHIMVDGKAVRYNKTSETAIVVSELSVFLSKSTYQSEMIQILLDLYDCRDEWDHETKGSGKKVLRNLHTSLFGGTTVDGLRNALPPSAKGDGFLSRTILVHVPDTKREYRIPFIPRYAPSQEELAKRLAWIVEHTTGGYSLSPEADAYAAEWYHFFSQKKRDNPAYMAAWSRMDVNVYKTALLLHAQRYDVDPNDKTIELCDIKDAVRLLDLTYSSFPFLMSQISSDDYVVAMSTIEDWLKRHKCATRLKLLRSMRCNSEMVDYVISEFLQRGWVKVTLAGKPAPFARRGNESYVWTGGNDDGTGEAEGDGRAEGINFSGAVWVDSPNGDSPRSEPHGPTALHESERDKKAVEKKLVAGKAPAKRSKGRPSGVGKGASGRKAPKKRPGNR